MMKLNEADIHLLEDYWSERLTPEERAAVEKRLEEDADFRTAAAEWEQFLAEGFGPPAEEAEELQEIKKRLATYGQLDTGRPEDREQATSTFQLRRIYIGLAAAAAILLLFLFTPLGELFQPADPYADYFTHLPRDNANLSDNTENGRLAYDRQDYQSAYPALVAEVAAGADSLNLLYAAVAAIGSGQPAAAVSILEPLVDTQRWVFYREELQWYLALGYLGAKEPDKARELLQLLADENGTYAEKAREILDHSE